jgi:Cu/Ag efflux protein CusF
MQKLFIFGIAALLSSSVATCAAQEVVRAVEGQIKSVDASSKTIVVETDNGVDHSLHYVERTAIRGTDQAANHDVDKLERGTKIVAHYTTVDGKDTVREIDRLGQDGLKAATGTIDKLDRRDRLLVLRATDGTETRFRLSDHAAIDAGKEIEKAGQKSAHVTEYYMEEADKKEALFFQVLFGMPTF